MKERLNGKIQSPSVTINSFYFCLIFVALAGCEGPNDKVDVESSTNEVQTACGNGSVDPDEVCDPSAPTATTCTDLGFDSGGSVECNTICHDFVTDACTMTEVEGHCGNGVLEEVLREDCDPGIDSSSGANPPCAAFQFNRASYLDVYNLGSGQVGCTDDGRFDLSDCDFSDACEALGLYDDGRCHHFCEDYGGVPDPDCVVGCAMDGVCNARCANDEQNDPDCECGNGVAEFRTIEFLASGVPGVAHQYFQDCDGSDFAKTRSSNYAKNETCADLGFAGGILSCNDFCQYDLKECVPHRCGNGFVEDNSSVECDGSNFSYYTEGTCVDYGFESGDIACTPGCSLSFSQCILPSESTCGDGVLEEYEECDPGSAGNTSSPIFRIRENYGPEDCNYYRDNTVGEIACTVACNVDESDCLFPDSEP